MIVDCAFNFCWTYKENDIGQRKCGRIEVFEMKYGCSAIEQNHKHCKVTCLPFKMLNGWDHLYDCFASTHICCLCVCVCVCVLLLFRNIKPTICVCWQMLNEIVFTKGRYVFRCVSYYVVNQPTLPFGPFGVSLSFILETSVLYTHTHARTHSNKHNKVWCAQNIHT